LSFCIFPACYCLHLKFLTFYQFIILGGAWHIDLLSTEYSCIASEERLESSTIYPAHETCPRYFCQLLSR
jgi:hypothetical protein